MMEFPQIIALSIFISYFLLIFGLFWAVFRSLLASVDLQTSFSKTKVGVFVALAAGALAHTWFYMFKFLEWSFLEYEKSIFSPKELSVDRLTSWLLNTSLFEQAWAAVCNGSFNWMWSEQLCLFTVGAWTMFLATEGNRYRVKHVWAYMLLGQAVAISVASNLFYAALLLSHRRSMPPAPSSAPPRLWISVLISLVTIAASPFTSERTFLPNLLVMHGIIVIPLLSPSQKPSRFSLNTDVLYYLIFISAGAMRIKTMLYSIATLPFPDQTPYGIALVLWDTLHSHPAQSSIGWDIVWTSISFLAWVALRPYESTQLSKTITIPYLMLASPVASIGVTAPYILRPREMSESEAGKEE